MRACVRARARGDTRRARARGGQGDKGGGTAKPSPATARRTALPNGGPGGRPTARGPRTRAQQASAATWRGRAGPSPRRTGPRRRARGSARRGNPGRRIEKPRRGNHDGWPGPGRQLVRALPNGAAAHSEGRGHLAPDNATTPRRRGGGGGRHGAGAAEDPREATRDRQARPTPLTPLTEPGKAERDGRAAAAAAAEETRRPPPPRGSEARGRGAAATAREAGGAPGATARLSRGRFSLGEKERKERTGPGA